MKNENYKKHFFFDLDGTVTASRQKITKDMCDCLDFLKASGKDIIVISGAAKDQMLKQLDAYQVDYLLAQSGNDTPFWKKLLNDDAKREVYRHVEQLEKFYKDKNILGPKEDLLQDRGSQMSFSFLGHNADIVKKKAFDPKGEFRREALKNIPFNSMILECRIGGTTCFDYTYQGYNKGRNIKKLIEHLGWNKDECIYFGDALFEGGNDETVLGVINTIEVIDPKDLVFKLKNILEKDAK